MRVTRTLRATVGAALTGALLITASGTASADQTRKGLWPLEAFGAEQLWQDATGKGVTVAVLDSGFRKTHQDLKGQFLPGPDFGKATQEEGAQDLEPGENVLDHGTGMAAIIAGHGHGPGGSEGVKGLAPDAKILPVPEYKNSGLATRWAADHGADVINMSYTEGRSADTCEAIHYAISKGAVVVAGMGNESATEKNYPVGCPGVIGVGAVDEYGKSAEFNNYNSDMDLLAPGVKIPAATGKSDSSYHTENGNSGSTAYVSAAAALLKEKFPNLTPGQIANRLVKTAGLPKDQKDLKLPDAHYGYGYIQPGPALRKDIPAGSKEGPLPMPKGKASAQLDAGAQDADPPMGGKEMMKKALLYGGIGLGALVVIGAVIAIVVVSRRRKNASGQSWG
ncbi:S8 family serine peptidase [Streptomyces tubercidicus]|uniref:Type VII secretion-associated serine protease n=1 Tax=Streptomyces tubercidicus TaxID=47759 RepID=A0A640UTP2_9ACTN|nr:S8 family serine peptidase [Streptomyces tubercidicus]WAU12306.1 S8 family serine peptidase [Streptomyces tubercidicus]GFE37715.1 type VII secretion-associated serine protease [Streptomyces tubercidicus]